jgi:two-component system osmolarity sensor histidine kinase EnvZ
MASPASTERSARRRRLRRLLGYGAVAAGSTAFSLLLLHLLLGRQVQQAQIRQMGSEVAFNVRLMDVALEQYGPAALGEITGLRLVVGSRPEREPSTATGPGHALLRAQAARLRRELCERLPRCPAVWPSLARPRGVWVEMNSPLETVWLFAPLPALRGWPPDPLQLSLALVAGALSTMLLFLALEVQRPLRLLEEGLAGVGLEDRPAALPARGVGAVRRLTLRFNAMLERLEQAGRERATMLAGIAHDLRSPLTRLRLRLGLGAEAPPDSEERARAGADLDALERITRQFLVYAGAEAAEAPLPVPLHELVAEAAAGVDAVPLELDLAPLQRRVRPTALSRAVANLLDNARHHGRPPLRLVLRGRGDDGFTIEVWDAGAGIATADWERALQPFQRLDRARSGQGHCGLGLAIADRVARDHGGRLECRQGRPDGAPGFAVILTGRSLRGD